MFAFKDFSAPAGACLLATHGGMKLLDDLQRGEEIASSNLSNLLRLVQLIVELTKSDSMVLSSLLSVERMSGSPIGELKSA